MSPRTWVRRQLPSFDWLWKEFFGLCGTFKWYEIKMNMSKRTHSNIEVILTLSRQFVTRWMRPIGLNESEIAFATPCLSETLTNKVHGFNGRNGRGCIKMFHRCSEVCLLIVAGELIEECMIIERRHPRRNWIGSALSLWRDALMRKSTTTAFQTRSPSLRIGLNQEWINRGLLKNNFIPNSMV